MIVAAKRRLILPAISILVFLAASCAPAAKTPSPAVCAPGTRREEIVSGGQLRSYQIRIPALYKEGTAVPLVLGFHGNGGRAEDFAAYSGFSDLAEREGFIAVFPQGLGELPTWDTWGEPENADVLFARDLIESVAARCSIDRARIFAVGHSRGGGMADRLACNLADEIAAIGSVSGYYESLNYCAPVRPVAIVAFHGTADPVVPYNGIGDPGAMRSAYFTIGTPIPEWAAAWAARNGCRTPVAEILREGTLSGQVWTGCRNGGDVVLYTIQDGGHGWPEVVGSPTGASSAAAMIWKFLVLHPFPANAD